MAAPTEPIFGTYQDIALVSARSNRTSGLESDSYSVVLGWSADIPVEVDVPLSVDDLFPNLGQRPDDASTEPVPTSGLVDQEGFGIRGDLILTDNATDTGLARAQDLYVRDDGLRILSRDQRELLGETGPQQLVQADLVDIRYFWNLGVIFGDFNIIDRKRDEFYIQTIHGSGSPWTLLDFVGFCLQALPGRLPVARFPEALEPMTIEDRSYRFDNPRDALADVLEKHGLIFNLSLENQALFDELDTGEVGLGPDNETELPPEIIRERLTVKGPAYRAQHIIVVGPPATQTIQVPGWEAVGKAKDGTIKPIEDALTSYSEKLTIDLMERILIHADNHMAGSFLTETLELLESQAEEILSFTGRMYRLPGAAASAQHVLPIEDRAETDADTGERLPILVEARTWMDARLDGTAARKSGDFPEEERKDEDIKVSIAGASKARISQIKTFVAGLGQRRGGKIIYVGDPLVNRDAFRNRDNYLKESGLDRRPQFQVVISRAGGQVRLAFEVLDDEIMQFDSGFGAQKVVITGEAKGETAPRGKKRTPLLYVNNARHKIDPNDYELDRDLGIITFKRPMGWVEEPDSFAGNRVQFLKAQVTVTFGFTWKSNPSTRRASQMDHWVAAYDLNEGEEASLDAAQRGRASAFPRILRDPSLQWLVGLDGESNQEDLEQRSIQLALDTLGRPQLVTTETILLSGAVPVETNGRVLSVAWDMTSTQVSTEMQVGGFLGIRGAKGFRAKRVTTRALGFGARLDAVLAEASGARDEVTSARQKIRGGK